MTEIVVIIRPSFKKVCGPDACRAALYNHILYRLARKAKTEPDEKVKKGEVFWYASAEDICTDIDEAWCVNKVRKEVKLLAASGLLGQRHNPLRKWDRRFQYFMSEIEGKALLEKAAAEGVCLLHIGLKAEVLHLLHMVNAFDKNGGCICHKEEIDLPDMVAPSTTNGGAISEGTTEESDTEESTEESDEEKGEKDRLAMARLWASAPTPPLIDFSAKKAESEGRIKVVKPTTPHSQMAHDEERPAVQEWDSDGLASTAKVPAVPKGASSGQLTSVTQPAETVRGVIPGGAAPVADSLPPSASNEPRAPGAKQAALSLKDDAPRPLPEKTLRTRYEAHFWQIIDGIRQERSLKPLYSSRKSWCAKDFNQSGITDFYSDAISDEDIAAAYRAVLDNRDTWLKTNFTVARFYTNLPGLLDAKPATGKAGKGKNAPVEDENDPYSFVNILKRQEQQAASA